MTIFKRKKKSDKSEPIETQERRKIGASRKDSIKKARRAKWIDSKAKSASLQVGLSPLARKDIGKNDRGGTGKYVSILEANVSYPDKRDDMEYGYLRELEFTPHSPGTTIRLRTKFQKDRTAESMETVKNASDIVSASGNVGSFNKQREEAQDVFLAAANIGSHGFLVDYRIYLIIQTETEAEMEYELDTLDKVTHASQQYKPYEFTMLLDSVEFINNTHQYVPRTYKSFTVDNQEFTSVNPYPKGTVSDKDGIPVGHRNDIVSNALVSLNLNDMVRRSLIAFDENKVGHLDYAKLADDINNANEEDEANGDEIRGIITSTFKMPESSLTLQRVANQNVLDKHRSIHIVANGYDPNLTRGGSSDGFGDLARIYNVNDIGINMMQVFGEPAQVGSLYQQNLDKIVAVFDQLSEGGLDKKEKNLLKDFLIQYYEKDANLKKSSDEVNGKTRPHMVKIINTKDENYPTAADFLNTIETQDLTTNSSGERFTDEEINMSRNLKRVLKNALSANRSLFTTKTKVGHENFRQLWFSLREYMGTPDILNVQIMNTLSYVNSRLKEGDMVLLHGCENINEKTWDVILPMIRTAELKGVKFTLGFGVMTTAEKGRFGAFDLKGKLYNNMYDDFDWLMFSNMSREQGDLLKNYIPEQEVNPATIDTLVETQDPSMRFFVRKKDRAKTLFESTINS